MSDEEAAGLLYTGLTAWCALKMTGGLNASNAADKNVLVMGGSGGVGNCAIQILKSWGAKVNQPLVMLNERNLSKIIQVKHVQQVKIYHR